MAEQARASWLFTCRADSGVRFVFHHPKLSPLNQRGSIFSKCCFGHEWLWLLTHESGHAADIARGTFYFPRTVDETLKELATSGMVKSARAGREKHYWLKPSEWSFLQTWNRPDGLPRWVDWARFFTTQERIAVVLSNRDLSPMLQASELRRVFDEFQQVLTDGGFLPAFAASGNDTGVAFTDAVLEDVSLLFTQL